jgi:hypothetical protein
MNKSLTWQQVIVGLLLLPMMIACILAFSPDVSRKLQNVGQCALGIMVPVSIALIVWHICANNLPDVHPDVLAIVRPTNDILQASNAAHFWLSGTQSEGVLTLTSLIQNLFDAETSVDICLTVDAGGRYVGTIPALATVLAPAQVALASISLPLRPIERPSEVRLLIKASARAEAGSRVRYARRGGVTKKVNPAVTGALLLTGTLHSGGGTFLKIGLLPFKPSDNDFDSTLGGWDMTSVWEIGSPTDPKLIAQLFA